MSREYIFHGKRISDGGWVEGDLLHLRESTCIYSPRLDGVYDVDPDTVGQYTGLTINDEMVFEGHIIKCRHEWSDRQKEMAYFGNCFEDETDLLKEFYDQKIKCVYGKHTGLNDLGTAFYYYRNYVVEYDKKTGGWRLRNSNVIHQINVSTFYNRRAEIIGNIHDNPELLKGEQT